MLFFILAIFGIGFLVLVHESGHFILAKLLRIKVKEFYIGLPFGPEIFSFQRGETRYGVRWVLLGGYVSLHGEKPGEENSQDKDSFYNQPAHKKIAITLAGPLFNYVFALLVVVFFFMRGVYLPSNTIYKVEKGSPAQISGLVSGDRILKVGKKSVKNWDELSNAVKSQPGQEVVIILNRNDKLKKVRTKIGIKNGKGYLGIQPRLEKFSLPFFEALKEGAAFTWWQTKFTILLIVKTVYQGTLLKYTTSVVGATAITTEAARVGWDSFLSVLAAISLALALANLLPILPADGGNLVIQFYEGLTRRRINPKVLQSLQIAGLTFLGFLFVYVIFSDIRILITRGVHGFFEIAPP